MHLNLDYMVSGVHHIQEGRQMLNQSWRYASKTTTMSDHILRELVHYSITPTGVERRLPTKVDAWKGFVVGRVWRMDDLRMFSSVRESEEVDKT